MGMHADSWWKERSLKIIYLDFCRKARQLKLQETPKATAFIQPTGRYGKDVLKARHEANERIVELFSSNRVMEWFSSNPLWICSGWKRHFNNNVIELKCIFCRLLYNYCTVLYMIFQHVYIVCYITAIWRPSFAIVNKAN